MMQSSQSMPRRNGRHTPEEQRRRVRSRRKIVLALRTGVAVQALLTLILLGVALWVPALAALRGQALMWLTVGVFLIPCWLGNALSGYLAPRYSAWQWGAYGLPIAFGYLLAARLTPFSEGGNVLHCWLTFNLVLCPALAGMLGHARRVLDLKEKALRPRPWRG
jgi:MFS family permease